MMASSSRISKTMIINDRLTGLRPSFLRSYTPIISIDTASSCVAVVQRSSSWAIHLIWARSSSILCIPISASSRLVRSTGAAIDIMNVFLESVCYFRLVLLSFTPILSMPVLRSVTRLVIWPVVICLSTPGISRVNMEVLFRGLPSHFIRPVLGLGSRTRGLHAWAWGTCSSSYTLSMGSILLYNIDCLLHRWGALAATSPITVRSSNIWLHGMVWGRHWLIRSISAVVFLILMWWGIVKIRITIQIGVSIRLFNLAGSQFLQVCDAWLKALNTLLLSGIPVSMGLGLLMDVHGVMSACPLGRLVVIWWRVALIMVISTTTITSSICFSLHFD